MFYLAAAVAILSTLMVITRLNAVHALLYLIVSLLSVALIFFMLGAPFAAALEVIIYAGAIMILFVFVIMMLNLGPTAIEKERLLLAPGMWPGPALLTGVLLAELFYILAGNPLGPASGTEVTSLSVGLSLFGPYMLGVELASILLLAGLVGAFHLARQGTEMEGTVNRANTGRQPTG
ncbi:MAG: NADH-quinone oxidoreductase subunit J [Thermodesulfobacteriota bacterium]